MTRRAFFLVLPLLPLASVVGCSGERGDLAASANQEVVAATPDGGDSFDTRCRVVLRYAGQSGISGGETFFDPSTQESWVRYRAVVDVDTRMMTAGATVGLFYKSQFQSSGVEIQAIDSRDDANDPALNDVGAGLANLHGGEAAPAGFTRLAFATTTNTVRAGDSGQPALQMIPFVRLADGTTIWDHNRNPSPTANYDLDAPHNFHVLDDFAACPRPDSEDPLK